MGDRGGYEYPLALIAASLTLAETGPGRPSVDCTLLPRFKGSGYALLALVAAGAGSYLVTEKLNQPAQEEPASEPDVVDEPEPRFARDAAATTTA